METGEESTYHSPLTREILQAWRERVRMLFTIVPHFEEPSYNQPLKPNGIPSPLATYLLQHRSSTLFPTLSNLSRSSEVQEDSPLVSQGLHLFGRKSLHLYPYLWPSSPAILLASRLYSTVIARVATPILILARRKLGCRYTSIVASRRPIYHKRLIAIP